MGNDLESVEDPRAKKHDICGITFIGGTGMEWICINPTHETAYVRRKGDRTHRRGDIKFSGNPKSEQHYFVPRWPNRNKGE